MRVAFDQEQEQLQMEREAHVQRMALGKAQTEVATARAEALRNPAPAAQKNPVTDWRPVPEDPTQESLWRLDRSNLSAGAEGTFMPVPGTQRPRSATQRVITGTPEEMREGTTAQQFDMDQGFGKQMAANLAFAKAAQGTTDRAFASPAALGPVGAVFRAIGSISAQARAVAGAFDLSLLPLPEYDFPADIASESAEIQTRFLHLALMDLAANKQEGRAVSDWDMKQFYKKIGGGTGDPEQIFARLQGIVEMNYEKYQFDAMAAYHGKIPPDRQFEMPVLTRPEKGPGAQKVDWNKMSPQEIEAEWMRRNGGG
jgi:hypothetical protein